MQTPHASNTQSQKSLTWKSWDYRKPLRIPKVQELVAKHLFEDYAHRIAIQLSSLCQADISVDLVDLVQCPYSHYLQSLTKPTFSASFNFYPGGSRGILEVDPPIVYQVINQMLGGDPRSLRMGHNLNELEIGLTRKFFNLLLEDLRLTWEPISTASFSISQLHPYTSSLNHFPKGENCLAIYLKVHNKHMHGLISICLPLTSLLYFSEEFENYHNKLHVTISTATIKRKKCPLALRKIEIESTAVLAKAEMTLEDLHNLMPGDILDLGTSIYQPIDFRVEGESIFKATPGLTGRFKGVILQHVILKE